MNNVGWIFKPVGSCHTKQHPSNHPTTFKVTDTDPDNSSVFITVLSLCMIPSKSYHHCQCQDDTMYLSWHAYTFMLATHTILCFKKAATTYFDNNPCYQSLLYFLGNLGIYYEIWEHFNITKRSLTGQSNRSGKRFRLDLFGKETKVIFKITSKTVHYKYPS